MKRSIIIFLIVTFLAICAWVFFIIYGTLIFIPILLNVLQFFMLLIMNLTRITRNRRIRKNIKNGYN